MSMVAESRLLGSREHGGSFPKHITRQPDPEDRAMTYKEMVQHLLETYPPDRYRGDELMDHVTAEIEAAEARGAITPDVREKVYRHFGVISSDMAALADPAVNVIPPDPGGEFRHAPLRLSLRILGNFPS